MGKGDGELTTPEMRAARKAAFWDNLFSFANAKSWTTLGGALATLAGVYAASKGLPPEAGAAAVGAVGAVGGIIGGVLAAHPG